MIAIRRSATNVSIRLWPSLRSTRLAHLTATIGICLAAATLAGCSEKPADNAAPDGVGGIDASSAPTVAFTYSYSLLVPAGQLAAIQEQDAAACEKLGAAQCRVIGMRYSNDGHGDISGSLDIALARDLARGFGRDRVAAAIARGGRLENTEIDGTDQAPAIAAAQATGDNAAHQRAALQQRLEQPGLGDRERTELTRQITALDQDLAKARQDDSAARADIATTPMHFAYEGGTGLALSDSTFAQALQSTQASGRTMVWAVLVIGGIALPWALLALALLVLWRTPPVRRLRAFVARGRADTEQ
jgi:hypothetical protein